MDNEKRTNDNLDNEDLDLNNFSDNQDTMMFSWARKFGLLVFEIAKVVLISLAIILPIRMYLVQPFYVEGASMEPNFFQNEYLIINEISYRFEEPVRGEVIIFKNPKDTKTYFIKRVIGLPGETVEVQSGKVFINNKELKEEYIENFANPYQAAKYGFIDDIIEPRNTRFRIIRGLKILSTKKDFNPPKKHSNIPL